MTSWRERMKNIKWKQKFRHFLEIAADASDIAIHLRDKPKVQDYAAIGLKVANSWTHHADKFRKKPFKGWSHVDIWEYKDFLFEIGKRKCEYEIIQEREDAKAILMNINGIKFGWEVYTDSSGARGPYVSKNVSREDWTKALGQMVWDELGANSCEISRRKNSGGEDPYDPGTVFKVDRQENVHESKVAHSILDRSRAFLEKGYNRSIMLYGVPGTGKSSAMRFVAKRFGKYSLRINVGDLDYLTSEDMLLAIELLRPSTLIIDDFDRSINPTKLLTELEEFNNHVQLLMVSVNHIHQLDDAVIRPGRFDDIIEVDMLDEDIVNKLIGDNVPLDVKKRLRRLPIAFVVEFHKRRDVLGLDKALEEVVDLEKRMSNLQAIVAGDEPMVERRRRRRKKSKGKKAIQKDIEVEVIIGKDPNDN